MIKIQVIDKDMKKEAQILQDISFTPEQRFIRMFDLIEFGIVFSKGLTKLPTRPFANNDFELKKLK
jgi:hypothetical protein